MIACSCPFCGAAVPAVGTIAELGPPFPCGTCGEALVLRLFVSTERSAGENFSHMRVTARPAKEPPP